MAAFARFTFLAVLWIGAVIAAPLAAEEGSCLEHSLPDKLMAHFNSCVEDTGENATKDEEILQCVLKAGGMISESKFEIPESEIEQGPLTEAVKECQPEEGDVEVEILVQCLVEKFHGKCSVMEKVEMETQEEAIPEE
ncbi:hypothetical protein NPIL_410901 [Nephila pilipes]|uniref:Uncharacterized protein n=1 Tax=Nephila pilipes TaxID=299642 RepID=A0A8X6IK57_NEPPI|nr:hypothetical protein NPIL_410901 [Nephila pilipes]